MSLAGTTSPEEHYVADKRYEIIPYQHSITARAVRTALYERQLSWQAIDKHIQETADEQTKDEHIENDHELFYAKIKYAVISHRGARFSGTIDVPPAAPVNIGVTAKRVGIEVFKFC